MASATPEHTDEVARLRHLATAGALDDLSTAVAELIDQRDGALERYRHLAEHTSDVVFRLRYGPPLEYEYLGRQLEGLTGLPLEQLSVDPQVYRSLVHPEDLDALDPLEDTDTGGTVRTRPYRLLHRDGGVTWVETVAVHERDAEGRPIGLSGAIRDVSASWRREEALRAALDRERDASEELRAVARLKDALLSAVSHELRTPLTVLQGFAELLLTLGDDLPRSNRDAAIVAVERNARRLDELLSSILDLDRLGRNAVVLVPRQFSVSEVVDDAIGALGLADDAVVDDTTGVRVTADRAKLERVVENLLANAIKHGSTTAPVEVRAWATEDGVTIEVADRGPGLPPELRETIFEPFERGVAESATPGTGLGLALVRGFVDLHEGRAWVEDRVGGGASFRVWLPQPPPGQA